MMRRALALAIIGLTLLVVPACATAEQLDEVDRRAVEELGAIAPRDSGVEESLTGVECWRPSDNLLGDHGEGDIEGHLNHREDEELFRVLCRLHFTADEPGTDGAERYRDMICIGDLGAEPVTDYCYQWAYYSDMPVFEDQPGFFADANQAGGGEAGGNDAE